MQDGICNNVKNSNILSTLMTNSVIEWFLMLLTPKELYGQFSKCRCNYDTWRLCIIWLTVLWIIYNQALLYETIPHLIYIYLLSTGEVIGVCLIRGKQVCLHAFSLGMNWNGIIFKSDLQNQLDFFFDIYKLYIEIF